MMLEHAQCYAGSESSAGSRASGTLLLMLPLLCAHRFLRYCREEGGYTGYPYEEESQAADGLATDLHALHLGN